MRKETRAKSRDRDRDLHLAGAIAVLPIDIRELKQATLFSHGRKQEVNISRARTVVSPRFANSSSPLVKRYLRMLM